MSEPLQPSASKPPRPRSPIRKLSVVAVQRLTPKLTHITLAGPELEGFATPRPAAHIKLHMVPAGTTWNPADEAASRPPRRTYTPRRLDPAANRLDVDFVLHGHGLASTWAADARIGDTMFVSGPGGGYDVPADADTLLVLADDTALPAVGMILEAMPATCRPVILAEIADAAERRPLSESVAADPIWIDRQKDGHAPGAGLEHHLSKLDLPAGTTYVWIACEAMAMRRMKMHLLRERGLPAARLHTRGYWKAGETAYPDHDYGAD